MKIEWIIGDHSSCLAINDTRITNGDLYGIGRTCLIFEVDDSLLINNDGIIEMEVFGNELFINGEPTQGKVSKEDFLYHLIKIKERRNRFIKDKKHKHNWSLCWRERWKVEQKDINKALNLI